MLDPDPKELLRDFVLVASWPNCQSVSLNQFCQLVLAAQEMTRPSLSIKMGSRDLFLFQMHP
jgi:hypothetical protein